MADAGMGMKVYPTWELLEKVEFEEWDKLEEADKAKFQLIISAGTVYFTDDGSVRKILLAMFPDDTKTGERFRLM